MLKIYNESLPTHGQGALYAYRIGKPGNRWGGGLRISWGGYRLPFGYQRDRGVKLHAFTVGKLTITLLGVH